jgi:hypothetical protein
MLSKILLITAGTATAFVALGAASASASPGDCSNPIGADGSYICTELGSQTTAVPSVTVGGQTVGGTVTVPSLSAGGPITSPATTLTAPTDACVIVICVAKGQPIATVPSLTVPVPAVTTPAQSVGLPTETVPTVTTPGSVTTPTVGPVTFTGLFGDVLNLVVPYVHEVTGLLP